MAFGKSTEEKEAEREARRQAETRAAAQRAAATKTAAEAQARAQFLATPVGQATAAKANRRRLLQIQLVVGTSARETLFNAGTNRAVDGAGVLGEIEAVGWRLEHAGYVFVPTAETREGRFLGGQTLGTYLFRNTEID
jgi:hypothetical protein